MAYELMSGGGGGGGSCKRKFTLCHGYVATRAEIFPTRPFRFLALRLKIVSEQIFIKKKKKQATMM